MVEIDLENKQIKDTQILNFAKSTSKGIKVYVSYEYMLLATINIFIYMNLFFTPPMNPASSFT